MKTIDTLVSDIEAVLTAPEPVIEPADTEAFGQALGRVLSERLAENKTRGTLRMSNLGTPCDRKLWYTVNKPGAAIPLSAATRLKFLFGDLIEEIVLFLAKVAGHRVTHEQAEVQVGGVKGHIDSVIDDHLVDVKSASTPSFRKFAEHRLETQDDFGYLPQLGAYAHAIGHTEGSFLAVDKQHGRLVLDTYPLKQDIEGLVEHKKEVVSRPEPPDRYYTDEKFGESGNRKLGFQCTYCDFRKECWPGLRAFQYSRDVVYLTKVEKEPEPPEIEL